MNNTDPPVDFKNIILPYLYNYNHLRPSPSPWKRIILYLGGIIIVGTLILQILNYTGNDITSLKILFTTLIFVILFLFYQASYYSLPSISPNFQSKTK
jgi:hypothetical protein